MIRTFLLAASLVVLTACAAISPSPVSVEQRVAQFAGAGPDIRAPLRAPVDIRWSADLVPHIEAQTDEDLAFALGMVHAHLRAGQIQLLRRLSQGRLSEIVGPFAIDIDHAVRIIGFYRAAEKAEASLPPETRAFAQRFADGFNFQQARQPAPPEAGLMNLKAEELTVRDMLAIGRMAGADVNWFGYFDLMEAYGRPDFPDVWSRIVRAGQSRASLGRDEQRALLIDLLEGFSKSGSNSVAVTAQRSATGGALLANDPHLGMTLPNLWMLASVKSPSYRAVGMMIPGLPFVAVGRNPDLSWGGTNMRAWSSDLYDVSQIPPDQIRSETVKIGVRGWFDATRVIRHTPFGPILTDAAVIPGPKDKPIAVRWVGHEGTDELTAMLRAMRARTPDELRAALKTFGVSAQTMLFADARGQAGLILAATLPERQGIPVQPVLDARDPATHWRGLRNATTLPWVLNPREGFVASANNKPMDTDIPLGFAFRPAERIDRIKEMMRAREKIAPADLVAVQRDAVSLASRDLARSLAQIMREGNLAQSLEDFYAAFSTWDGSYAETARAPVLFETFMYHLLPPLFGADSHDALSPLDGDWEQLILFLPERLAQIEPQTRAGLFLRAGQAARADAARYAQWGDMHRLELGTVLTNIPLIGGWFTLADYPLAGSRETPMKTAHNFVRERHSADYGQQSRHISDMSDLDANDFILLGGNDGWLGSAAFIDQVERWRAGQFIRMPLRDETIKTAYPTLTRVLPAP